MPDLQWQRRYIAERYVHRILTYARVHQISRVQAELEVHQELELELENIARLQIERQYEPFVQQQEQEDCNAPSLG